MNKVSLLFWHGWFMSWGMMKQNLTSMRISTELNMTSRHLVDRYPQSEHGKTTIHLFDELQNRHVPSPHR